MSPTLFLVVVLFCDSPYRATFTTCIARAVVEEKTISMMVVIQPWGEGDNKICHHGTNSMSLAFGSNKAVTKAKGSKTCRWRRQ
jgi:hypothetical protein